ncbi:hypothetical protein [Nocardioides sp.]|uniref:hypothetical protein n=1 Tax=Nocardioides sp. TaxID=35761 RepID=UPI002ED9B8D7
MSREARGPAVRPYRTRWSVIAFVVIALAVGLAIMLWQLSGDPPEEADSAPAPPRTAPLLAILAIR